METQLWLSVQVTLYYISLLSYQFCLFVFRAGQHQPLDTWIIKQKCCSHPCVITHCLCLSFWYQPVFLITRNVIYLILERHRWVSLLKLGNDWSVNVLRLASTEWAVESCEIWLGIYLIKRFKTNDGVSSRAAALRIILMISSRLRWVNKLLFVKLPGAWNVLMHRVRSLVLPN